jgi:hypothetical protein
MSAHSPSDGFADSSEVQVGDKDLFVMTSDGEELNSGLEIEEASSPISCQPIRNICWQLDFLLEEPTTACWLMCLWLVQVKSWGPSPDWF